MDTVKHKFSYYLIPTLFFLLLLFNVAARTTLPFNEFSRLTTTLTLYIGLGIFAFFLFKKSAILKDDFELFAGLLAFSTASLLAYLLHAGTERGSESIIELLLFLTFFMAMVMFKWRAGHLFIFAHLSTLLIFLLTIHWALSGFSTDRFLSFFTNPNVSGIFFLCLLFFPIIALRYGTFSTKIYFGISIVLGLGLLYSSTARSAMLLLLTALCARAILRLSRRLFSWLFVIVMAGNALILLIYGFLASTPIASKLNEWSMEISHKGFFSGREEIWSPAIEYGMGAPLFGHGIGVIPRDYIEGTHYVHSHNQFLQVFLDSGFVGLACFVIFLYAIWRTYQKRLDSNLVQWSACFFLGLLVYQSFEMSLFFNMKPLGLLHWLIIAFGLSVVFNKTGDKERFR